MDKKRIHEMLEMMTSWCLGEMQKGKEQVCTEELGKALDMVKDLASAEKDVWEKCYYESIVEAMEEEEEWLKKEGHRMGYDRWRYSSGRYAPKGHGHETSMAKATGRAGFMPMDDGPWPEEYWRDGKFVGGSDIRYGYDDGRSMRSDHKSDGTEHHPAMPTSRSGFTPQEHPEEYVTETLGTMKDIFAGAEPHLQEKMINQFRNMCREFGLAV